MLDPDLQIRGGGGGSHPDPEIREAPVLKKHFSALQASVWSKNKGLGGGGAAPLDLPQMKFNQFSAFSTFVSCCAHIMPVFSTT